MFGSKENCKKLRSGKLKFRVVIFKKYSNL